MHRRTLDARHPRSPAQACHGGSSSRHRPRRSAGHSQGYAGAADGRRLATARSRAAKGRHRCLPSPYAQPRPHARLQCFHGQRPRSNQSQNGNRYC
ncbi:hypothetical protein WH87_04690 [Devosia epidermidihirudinis]|uniref:Uncharacterized protein n=1 Tax=Devosia epidermidihirudinis TaxID=1293439 RepID=A0A0F5QHJ7_9HYPH|nr:hypothetical protein WH87_04690 [Devosia epidermidihirudinis]